MLFKLYNISCLYIIVHANILIKLRASLTIITIASIMMIAGFVTAPDAFSSKNNDVPDECKCEKPDTLKVEFTAPVELQGQSFEIEVYKKLDDSGNPDKLLGLPITGVESGDTLTIVASFGKDKLESNTAFVVYNDLEVVAEMEIHTSCSKPLFITQKVFDVNDPNNGYSLEVIDGLIGENTSIPEFEPNSCEDEKKKSTGTITIRKALTTDSGGDAEFKDFIITVTNVKTPEIHFVLDDMDDDPSINTIDVPAGTYTISETDVPGFTTVLIAGDTGCPSMVDEVFTIKKGKHLSCTIYNDDDGTEDNGEIEPGVIFHVGTVQFDNMGGSDVPRCAIENTVLPCLFEDDDNKHIVPNLKTGENLHETTLVLLSVVGQLSEDGAFDPGSTTGCAFDGLSSFTETVDGGDDIMHSAFKIQCLLDGDFFRINYALIETVEILP